MNEVVFAFRYSTVKLTVHAINLIFLQLSVSGLIFFLIFLLYGYLEGHMTFDDFSWTKFLRHIF